MCLSVSGALRGLHPDHGRETLAVRWTLLAFLQVRELTFSRVGLRDKRFAKASDRLQVYGIKHAEAQFLHTYRLVGSVEKGVEREVAFGPGCSASLFIAVCGMVGPSTNSLHLPSSLLSLVLPTKLADSFHCTWGALKQALKGRYSTHSSLMFSAVRKQCPPMRRCARAAIGTNALHCGDRFERMALLWGGFEPSKRLAHFSQRKGCVAKNKLIC